jgi:hypothetical protein
LRALSARRSVQEGLPESPPPLLVGSPLSAPAPAAERLPAVSESWLLLGGALVLRLREPAPKGCAGGVASAAGSVTVPAFRADWLPLAVVCARWPVRGDRGELGAIPMTDTTPPPPEMPPPVKRPVARMAERGDCRRGLFSLPFPLLLRGEPESLHDCQVWRSFGLYPWNSGMRFVAVRSQPRAVSPSLDRSTCGIGSPSMLFRPFWGHCSVSRNTFGWFPGSTGARAGRPVPPGVHPRSGAGEALDFGCGGMCCWFCI